MSTTAFISRHRFAMAVSLATAMTISIALPTKAQTQGMTSAEKHKLVDSLFSTWSGETTPGCAVAIEINGTVDYLRGYGMANLEYAIPVSPDSIFNLASISKQFTAFSIGLLANEGKLSLEDDVRKYVPELPDYGKPITIAHLVHHTSGLREHGYLLNLAGWRGDDVYTEADVLQVLARQGRTNFEPGEESLYGNSAYEILRLVAQRASGKPMSAYAEEQIFKPLGMADTRFNVDHAQVVPKLAQGYHQRDEGWKRAPSNIDHYGSTGVLTTVRDLLKWQQNLMDGRVGGLPLATWMQTSGRLNDGTETTYGGGLFIRNYRGLRTVSHDGLGGGYRASSVHFPDQRTKIVALCNTQAAAAEELTLKIADIYLGDRMKEPAFAPAVPMPELEQSSLAGTYWSPKTDEIVRLEWREGALRQAGSPVAFVPIDQNVFRPGDARGQWRFILPGANATPELQIFDAWPTPRVFKRLADPLPSDSSLSRYTGEYLSDEVETTFVVRVSDGKLKLAWPREYEIELEAVGGDRFNSSRGAVTFTRNEAGLIDGLTISSRRTRKFRADRVSVVERAETPLTKQTSSLSERTH